MNTESFTASMERHHLKPSHQKGNIYRMKTITKYLTDEQILSMETRDIVTMFTEELKVYSWTPSSRDSITSAVNNYKRYLNETH